jgi:hypothetical protein
MPQSIALAQALPLLGAIIAFLFAALLVLYIFRLLFGQRVRAPAGTRNRPRRLDVVDTFELGRDRQLVVIRRDNVEHLLLIGGPNDLLVEGSISRMEARDQRPAPPPPREKEAAAAAEWPAAHQPRGLPRRRARRLDGPDLLPQNLLDEGRLNPPLRRRQVSDSSPPGGRRVRAFRRCRRICLRLARRRNMPLRPLRRRRRARRQVLSRPGLQLLRRPAPHRLRS